MKQLFVLIVVEMLSIFTVKGDYEYTSVATTVVGNSVTLNCSVRNYYHPTVWSSVDNDNVIFTLRNGEVRENFTDRYNLSCSREYSRFYGWVSSCDLTIMDVLPSDAGTYRCCTRYSQCQYPSLTVLLDYPSGQIMEPSPQRGHTTTISCKAKYVGPLSGYFIWTNESGDQLYESIVETTDIDNEEDVDSGNLDIIVTISELTIVVPLDAEYLPLHTCDLLFGDNCTECEEYSWTSDSIQTSYCPRDITLAEMDHEPKMTLFCNATSHPEPAFEWQVVVGSGYVKEDDSRQFVVTSTGYFNVSCTAKNKLNCSENTLYLKSCVMSTPYKASAIAFAVLFALSLFINIFIIVFIVLHFRKNNMGLKDVIIELKPTKSHPPATNDYIPPPSSVTVTAEQDTQQGEDDVYESADTRVESTIYEDVDVAYVGLDHTRRENSQASNTYQTLNSRRGRDCNSIYPAESKPKTKPKPKLWARNRKQ